MLEFVDSDLYFVQDKNNFINSLLQVGSVEKSTGSGGPKSPDPTGSGSGSSSLKKRNKIKKKRVIFIFLFQYVCCVGFSRSVSEVKLMAM